MILVTAGWGASYMWMKVALGSVPPLMLVGLRFTIAFVGTAVVFPHALTALTWRTVRSSLVLGSLLFGLFSLVVIGLQTTSASTAGFLVSTTAIFVTLFSSLIRREWPTRVALISTIIVIVGLYLLLVTGPLSLNGGAIDCLLCAALYAVYILYADYLTQHGGVGMPVSVGQLGVAGIEGLLFGGLFEPFRLPQTPVQWGAVLALGLICSAFGFVAQTRVQQYLTPATVSMVFSTEPIFSAVFAFLLMHETLSWRQMLGAFLIFASVLGAELLKTDRPMQNQRPVNHLARRD